MAAFSRRALLTATATVMGAFSRPDKTQSHTIRTRLILLGTGGGPRPRKASSASAQSLSGTTPPYVIDCGNGVARQLVFADVPLTTLCHIFVTHHHSDHNADYGNLIWLAWTAGSATSAHNSAAMRPSGEGVSSDFLPPRPSQQSLRWTSRIAGGVCSARA